jgi:hypothetical protein
MKRRWKTTGVVAVALVGLAAPVAPALDINWINGSGGTFSTPGNWQSGILPGAADFAHFQVVTSGTGPTYTVNFTGNATTRGMYVHRDNVTWNLGGFTYTQSTSTAFDPFLVGQNAGETGALTVSNGSINTSVASGSFNTVIGKAGNGTMTMNSGAQWTMTTPLVLAQTAGISGTFNVNAGSQTNVASSMYVGGSPSAAGGTGTITLAGGGLTVNGVFKLWNSGAAAPAGTRLNFTSGALTVGSIDTSSNPARFNWTGGDLTVNGTDFSWDSIGAATTTLGTGQSLTTQLNELVGTTTSVKTVNQSGGSNTVGSVGSPRNFTIGAGTIGGYNLSGAASTLTVSGNETVGSSTTGNFSQVGGTHAITGDLNLGAGFNVSASFVASGGTVSAANAYVGGTSAASGGGSNGDFLSFGGATVNIPGTLRVYPSTDVFSDNILAVGGGTLNVGTLTIPQYFNFQWTNGTINSAASVSISVNSSVAGDSTFFTDGTLNLTATKQFSTAGSARVGIGASTDSVLQTGGSNNVAAGLELGYAAGSSGTYTLQGGTISAASVYVGGNAAAAGGTGTLNVSGGTLTSTGLLRVWNSASAVNLSGGTLSVGAIDLGGQASRLNWTAGTLAFTGGNFAIADGGGLGNAINLGTGKTLSVTAGTLTNNGAITLAGGTLSSNVGFVNGALLTGYGTIAGTGLASNASTGQIIQSGGNITYANSAVLVNAGTITLATGYQFDASPGGGITNNATINLNGGTLVSAITNTANGTISGPGTITGTLDNQGMIDLPTGTLHTPNFTNTGVIALGGNGANFAPGSTVTNTGSIQGTGKVAGAVVNTGTIEAVGGTLVPGGGTLVLAGGVTNSSPGTIATGAGTKILLTGSLSNTGTISLTGGTFDTNGQSIVNAAGGNITGFGTVRAASISNNGGTITFSGTGGASYFGGLTNKNGGKTIVTGNATATFTGSVTNNSGTEFRVSAGATAVFLGAVTGAGSFTGSGTKIFEVSGSPSSLTSGVGDTVVEAPAAVSTNALAEDDVTINGGLLTFAAGATTAAVANTLTTTGVGQFDLGDNSMVVREMTAAQVRSLIQGAFNAGHWNGATGLNSSTAAADPGGTTAIGYGSNGILNKTAFKGVSPLTATDVLVKYTYYGDADLSGATTLDDFTLFLGGYQNGGTTWVQGDYDYSGLTTLDDFTLFLKGYQQQGMPLSEVEALINSVPMSESERAAMLAAVQAVPEPAALAVIGLAGATLGGRRRRWRRQR